MRLDIRGVKSGKPVHSLGLGVFDGMHLGHQKIADQCTALLTFSPHPGVVTGKRPSVRRLTTLRELRVLVPYLLVLKFDRSVMRLGPEEFLNAVIRDQISPQRIVVGDDFRFGAQARGGIEELAKWSAKNNLEFEAIPQQTLKGEIVKSERIRSAMWTGAFDEAVQFLGHPYLIIGEVIKGEGRGKRLGFPTANLKVPVDKCVPGAGVYAARVEVDNTLYKSGVYIGTQPTFGGKLQQIEVHILNFNQSLYGRRLKVFLTHKIRDEKRFSSEDELVSQLQQDLDY